MNAVKMGSWDVIGVVFAEQGLWCLKIPSWVMHFHNVHVLRIFVSVWSMATCKVYESVLGELCLCSLN